MVLNILCTVVTFAAVAMMIREGLWSNTLTFFNTIFSGLIAFGWYSPLAAWLNETVGDEYTYVYDFVSLWGLFALSMLLLNRSISAALSKTRLRFVPQLDQYGGIAVGLLTGLVLMSIFAAIMHTVPLPREVFGGAIAYNNDDAAGEPVTSHPDLAWLAYCEGAFGIDRLGSGAADFKVQEWVRRHAERRKATEEEEGLRVRR